MSSRASPAILVPTTFAACRFSFERAQETWRERSCPHEREPGRSVVSYSRRPRYRQRQREEHAMATPDRDSLANGLVSIGEDAVAKSNDALLDEYFTDDYKLHSPPA